jgi:hypothetical protein
VPQRVGWGLKLSLMSTPTLVASAADDCRATDLVELLPQAAKKSKFAGTNVQCRNSCKVFRPFAAPAYGRETFWPPTGPLPRRRAGGLCGRPYHRGEGHENAI